MRRFAFLSFFLLAMAAIVASGRPMYSESSVRTPALLQANRGKDLKAEGISENIFELWQALTQEQPLQPSTETSTRQVNYLLRGDYIFSSTGASYDFGRTNVQSAIGIFTFDGSGNFTGVQQSRTLFTGTQTFRFGGTYTVDSSGAGFLFYLYPTPQTHTIIVIKGGDAFFFVDVNSSNFREAGYARRLN